MIDYDRYDRIRAVQWTGHTLRLLDQRLLPLRTEFIECADADAVAAAIRNLTVRGAPAIGIAAAYGIALAARMLADAGGLVRAEALRDRFEGSVFDEEGAVALRQRHHEGCPEPVDGAEGTGFGACFCSGFSLVLYLSNR